MATLQQNFTFDRVSGILQCKVNGKRFKAGLFSTPTLCALKARVRAELTQCPVALPIRFDHVAIDDILPEHFKYPGALFQAASQFNCLEFDSPKRIPENGITDYAFDMTQGPACALACAAGTLVRNYFVHVPLSATPRIQCGQSKEHQLNNLSELEQALDNNLHQYWHVKNGYTFCDDKRKLRTLAQIINSEAREDLIGHVKIGLQQDVGVNFRTRTEFVEKHEENHVVTQVYGSAISCSYSGVQKKYWAPLAQLVLDANYEATIWAGVLNYLQKTRAQKTRAQRTNSETTHETNPSSDFTLHDHADMIFLTMLGGGVFGNDKAWIAAAIGRSIVCVEQTVKKWVDEITTGGMALGTETANAADESITVRIMHYLEIDPQFVHMVNAAVQENLLAVR